MQMNTPAAFEPGIALPATLSPTTLCYIWRDDRILVRATEPPAMPTLAEVERAGLAGTRLYLGRLDGVDCIALHAPGDSVEPDGWQWRGLRSLFLQIPERASSARRPRVPDRRMESQSSLLRPLRDPDARQSDGAVQGVPGVRAGRLSAHFAGDDGARHARTGTAARARQPLSQRDVQRARRLRRAG